MSHFVVVIFPHSEHRVTQDMMPLEQKEPHSSEMWWWEHQAVETRFILETWASLLKLKREWVDQKTSRCYKRTCFSLLELERTFHFQQDNKRQARAMPERLNTTIYSGQ